ncbi:alpha-(1,3)-fucosyltransferase C-like [Patella vulgata]|uniref:alpha-(1,3)-fucosyltransferase C-like n=1 Tax=Patella vulgata TaxID=6465 RepID=UPI0024A95B3C|nr:alpha-(1,3)-fucosyltransferase C-like [Patella vulgata]
MTDTKKCICIPLIVFCTVILYLTNLYIPNIRNALITGANYITGAKNITGANYITGAKTITGANYITVANYTISKQNVSIHWINPPPHIKKHDLKRWVRQCNNSCFYRNYNNSDVVIFDGNTLRGYPPKRAKSNQIWIFHEGESPPITASHAWRHPSWINQFNRTMSYRLDADIFAPYGWYEKRKSPLKKNITEIMSKKSKLAVILSGHCGVPSARVKYVNLLRKYMPVDFYGRCGNMTCDKTKSHHNCTSKTAETYKFYLSFENTFCKDYATEKFFRAEASDIVAVVRGGANYSLLSPEKNYIQTSDFNSVEALANYLKYLDKNETAYIPYLERKWKYDVYLLEGGYPEIMDKVYAQRMCDVCKNSRRWLRERKIYDNISDWYEKDICHRPTDIH